MSHTAVAFLLRRKVMASRDSAARYVRRRDSEFDFVMRLTISATVNPRVSL